MRTHAAFFHLPHHKEKNFSSFFVASLLRTFVLSFLIIFLPALIFKQYLPFGERGALLITIFYFLFANVGQMFFIVPASYMAAAFGVRFNFLSAQFFLILFLTCVQYGLYGIGFLMLSIAASFWWYTYHLYFADFGHKERYGHELGVMEAVSVVSGALAPVVGGYIIITAGPTALYSFGMIIAWASMIFVVLLKEPAKVRHITVLDIMRVQRKNSDDFIAFVGAGAEEAIASIIWPVLLFMSLKDFLKVGSYFSLVMLVVVLVNFIVGALADSIKKDKLEEIGAVAVFTSWVGRAFSSNPVFVGVFEIIYKLFISFFRLPLLVIAYDHAYNEKEDYIAFREIAYKVGAVVGYVTFIVILIVNLPLWSILIFSGIYSLLPLKIKQ